MQDDATTHALKQTTETHGNGVMIIIEQHILKLVGRGRTMRWPRGGRICEKFDRSGT